MKRDIPTNLFSCMRGKNMEIRDVVIIGGGPGGLSASIYCIRNGLRTLVIEKGICGGLVAEAPWIENYLGFEGLKGMDLAEKFKDHARKYADIREFEEVLNIELRDKGFLITTDKETYETRSLILAQPSESRRRILANTLRTSRRIRHGSRLIATPSNSLASSQAAIARSFRRRRCKRYMTA